MSQVRKFSKGGDTAESTEKKSNHDSKYGHYIVDGKTYDVNDDFINNYITSAKKFNDAGTNRIASYVINTLKSGQDVSFDTLNNRVTGINQYLNTDDIARSNEYYSGPQNNKMRRKYQRKEINKNTDLHQTNIGIKNLGSIQFTTPKEEPVESPKLIDLYGEDRTLDYNKNADGSVTWSTGPQNAGNIAAINNFFDFLGMSNEEADKKYSYKGKENWISDLRNWYKNNQNYKEDLISRMQSNQLDGADWDVLSWMGFTRDENSNDSTSSASRSYEGSGFNNDALEQAGYYVKKDKDGNVYLYDNSGNVVQDKIYLKETPWANGTQWENGAVYKGRFYTNDQIMNQNNEASQAIRSLFDLMNAAKTPEEVRQAALNSTWKIYGMNNESPYETYDSKSTYLKGFNDLFQNGTYYWNDITGNYNLGNNSNTRILSIYGTERNPDGTFKEQYAVSDNNGYAEILDGIEALQDYLNRSGITEYTGYNPYKPLRQYNSVINNGRRYIRMDNPYKIADQNIDIYRDENGKYYVTNSKGGFTELYGNNIIEAIKNGTATHEDLRVGNKRIQNPDQKWWWSSQRKWIEGFDKSNYQPGEYDEFFNYYKKGGKVQKKQFGGLMSSGKHGNTNTEASDFKVGQATKAFGTPKELKTSTDKLSKAAGWLDTAGAAATFIPGYGNIAGAITGALGSLLRLQSDIQRDGAQISDFTKFAGNIGLDLLTLIPGAGSAAKAAKIAKGANAVKDASKLTKSIKQVAEPVLNFIGNNSRKITGITSGAGIIGGGAMIGSSLFGDDEFTSDDFATAAQGALGITGGIKNLHNLKKSAEAIQTIAGKKTFNEIKNQEGDKWNKRVSNAWKNWRGNSKANSENKRSIRSLMFNDRLANQTLQESLKNNPDLRKLATDKNSHLDEALFNRLQNEMGQFLSRTGQTYILNGKTIVGKQINPSWYNGQQFTTAEKSNILALPPHISTGPVNPIKPSVLQLPAWKGNNIPEVNILPSSNSSITTPSSSLIQIPQFASSYQNAQGQLLLPRGNGRFFKKTQRVWNGGPAHEVIMRQPAKYSVTPKKPRFRNIGLEQAHKQRVLQEAGRQQVPAIRGLQEDIAKVRTSEDFKNLLVKINNRGSYKEIIKNNPEIKDQLRQMFIHLDPVRLGNWMTKYNLRFKQGGKIVKAQNGVKWNPGDLVMDNNLADPNLYNYQSHGISFNGSNVDWTKTYATNSQFNQMRQNYINNWNKPEFNNVKQAYLNQLSSNNNNIDVSSFSLEDFKNYTSDRKLGWAHKLNTNEYKQFIHTLPAATVTATKSTLPQIIGKAVVQNQSNPIVSQINSRLNNTSIIRNNNGDSNSINNKVSNENSTGNDATGIEKKNWFNFNPDDLIGGLELARSLIANNRMYGELKDANRAVLREMPTEIYDRYQDHITPIYQEAANQKRQFFVPTSTDALTNYAMRQVNEDAAQALLTEGRLKASEAYSQYLDKDLAARRAYAEDRRQTAFANRQEMANKVMRDAQIDQARRLANNQSWSNFVMEMRNKISQDRNRSLNFLQQQDQLLAQQKMNESLSNFEKEWRDKFAALSEDERKSKNYLDWQDYAVRSDPQAYQKAMAEANLAGQQYLLDNQNKYVDYIFNRVPIIQLLTNNRTVSMPATGYYKKGGKVSNKYTQRHYGPKPDEAIWIQRNKDTAKALEKLHDAVIKLFMKSIS